MNFLCYRIQANAYAKAVDLCFAVPADEVARVKLIQAVLADRMTLDGGGCRFWYYGHTVRCAYVAWSAPGRYSVKFKHDECLTTMGDNVTLEQAAADLAYFFPVSPQSEGAVASMTIQNVTGPMFKKQAD